MALALLDGPEHSTTGPAPQSDAAWVREAEADFRLNNMHQPFVHEFRGQDLSVPQFRTIYEYWSSFPDINGARVIEKINPFGFKRALGDIMLVEPLAGNTDFRYRLFGSNMASRLGTDMTGSTVSELVAAPAVKRFVLRSYQAVVEERQAYLTMHILPEYVSTENWRRLILPICDAQGDIYRLLVCNIAGDLRML